MKFKNGKQAINQYQTPITIGEIGRALRSKVGGDPQYAWFSPLITLGNIAGLGNVALQTWGQLMNTILQSFLTPGALPYRLALLLDSHQQSSIGIVRGEALDITPIVLTEGIPALRSLAKEATVERPQVWRLQADLFDAQQVAMLDSISQLVLRVEPVTEGWNNPDKFIVHARYSRTWEHVERETVLYDHGAISKLEQKATSAVVEEEKVPVSTFDLSLSAEQKEKKDALDLPHLRLQSQQPVAQRSILADDFDDEDPDADLDV